MRVLFLAPEVAPFLKTGGLGDVAKALPAALARAGHEVMVVTPRYAAIRASQLERCARSVRLRFPFGEERAELLRASFGERHQVIFLDHLGFYGRPHVYADEHGDYPDNHRRFAFFAIAGLAAAQVLEFRPDVVHLNDWQSGLAAVALRTGYAHTELGEARCVFTIHNLAYQGVFPKEALSDLGLPFQLFTPEHLEFHDAVSFLKAGLAFSDAWTTVSPSYAREIQTPEQGFGLEGFIHAGAHKLSGILNGADYSEWNPEVDRLLPARYSARDLAGKQACKEALKERFGLPRGAPDRPLFGVVTRLTPQKGVDLILGALPRALERGMDFLFLGRGDPALERELLALPARYPGRVGARVGFDPELSHLVEAGSDFFLMPSRFEPCGLNQMYSLRYGTPPVVHATGGLEDTVVDADVPDGTGFKFTRYQEAALLWAMDRAREVYRSAERLLALRQAGMAQDFSWEEAARKYHEVYREARD